jgi:phosphate transport system protein
MSSVFDGDPIEGHTVRVFDRALAELRFNTVAMGGLVIDQVSTAVRALLDGDATLANLVLSREQQVNRAQDQIDREAFELIALHQPMAGDLRLARAITRITIDLERAGDEAKKIARFALALTTRDEVPAPVVAVSRYLRHMAELSAGMLRHSVRALDEWDIELARSVATRDEELDDEFETAMRQMFTVVMEGERFLRTTINTVFALKGLERIGDHAKNIAEQVVFMLSGAQRVFIDK